MIQRMEMLIDNELAMANIEQQRKNTTMSI